MLPPRRLFHNWASQAAATTERQCSRPNIGWGMDPGVTGAAPIHDITNMEENCMAEIIWCSCKNEYCRHKLSIVLLKGQHHWIGRMSRLRVQMNGGLWRRVETSITLGNNAMTKQRDSGMTIALERIHYWEIELIDGSTADTRETRVWLNNLKEN